MTSADEAFLESPKLTTNSNEIQLAVRGVDSVNPVEREGSIIPYIKDAGIHERAILRHLKTDRSMRHRGISIWRIFSISQTSQKSITVECTDRVRVLW